MNSRWVGRTAMVVVSCLVVMAGLASGVKAAHAPPLNRLDLRVLLIGQPGGDPTTQAWQAQLSSEGVPYTLAAAQGTPGSQTVALPNLTDPSDSTHGLFNGVVIASSVYNFAWGPVVGRVGLREHLRCPTARRLRLPRSQRGPRPGLRGRPVGDHRCADRSRPVGL